MSKNGAFMRIVERRLKHSSPRTHKHVQKLDIANRGEIAVRASGCANGNRRGGPLSTYAALHVRKADEAYPIGAAAASESDLNIRRFSTSPCDPAPTRPTPVTASFREV